jgi:hypothetical protein
VYIYRDTGDSPDSAAPGHGPDERDASYWYDLPTTGTGAAPEPADTRGPFEPLVSSHGPVPMTPEPVPESALVPEPAPPPDSSASGKLEQIREFYRTAEAIGEQNVDKHFDHLLAQQRELISEYFKQSPAAPAGADAPDRLAAPSAGDVHGASVTAEQPRVW